MRLKEIKPGMVIHCNTQEEANKLCDAVCASKQWKEYWGIYKDDTCYQIGYHAMKTFGSSNSYSDFIITEFSDLILPELTAYEVLNTCHTICEENSCNQCLMRNDCFTCKDSDAKKIIEICEQWKSDHEKKEPEIEWVYRVFGAENYGEKFFQTEEEAIKRCEELAKSQKTKQYARYERICRVKAVE